MNSLEFYLDAPRHWDAHCVERGDLFNSSEWQTVIQRGFGTNSIYGWDPVTSTGITVNIFKAGPFRIGYLGFPVGGSVGNGALPPHIVQTFRETDLLRSLDCFRIPVSAFSGTVDLPLPFHSTPETAIENLQAWNPEADRKLRQNMNKARRSALKVVDAADGISGESLFTLYKKTVARHGGNMRYSASYFNALLDLAKVNKRVRCLLAVSDGEVVGFEVVACHGETGYSLHGCTNPVFKGYLPSDMLTYEAISWANEYGMKCYNLMSSPPSQMSLVKYKEKWGGTTRQHKTYEMNLRPVRAVMFKVASVVYEGASRIIR